MNYVAHVKQFTAHVLTGLKDCLPDEDQEAQAQLLDLYNLTIKL